MLPPPSFRIKIPYPLQWGAPTFNAGHAFGMMAAVLVSLVEVLYWSTLAIYYNSGSVLERVIWKTHNYLTVNRSV